LHLVLWCPLFFLGGSEAHAFRSLLGPVSCWSSLLRRAAARVSFSVTFSISRPQRPVGISVQVSIFLPLFASLIFLPLCKDSGRAFDFLRRLASPRAGLGRYLPQVRRASVPLLPACSDSGSNRIGFCLSARSPAQVFLRRVQSVACKRSASSSSLLPISPER
jgi:hypothetical protein